MNFVQQVVTPEMAAEMLRHNVLNRRLNKTRVQTLISAIKNGTWTESPQPICFDKDGNLIDGQHRLEAIVRAEVPVVMTIAEHDADRDNYMSIVFRDGKTINECSLSAVRSLLWLGDF